MCGRFSQAIAIDAIAQAFAVKDREDLSVRYNVAPSQLVAAVAQSEGIRQLQRWQWGLIPSWSKDAKIGSKLINARAETVAEKPSFRAPFKRQRCLIPADGFYEWQQVEGSRHKQPYFIGLATDEPLAFAGLYDYWHGDDGAKLTTFTIVTTEANESMAPIHDRMPVIIAPQDYALWLDPNTNFDRVQSLLATYPATEMKIYPVSSLVNSPKNDMPECRSPDRISLFPLDRSRWLRGDIEDHAVDTLNLIHDPVRDDF